MNLPKRHAAAGRLPRIPVFAIVALLALGAVLMLVSLRSAGMGKGRLPAPGTHEPSVEQETAPAPSAAAATAWLPQVEEQFIADVYPSRRAAARSLGRQLASSLSRETANHPAPPVIHVHGAAQGSRPIVAAAAEDIARVLQSEFDETRLIVEGSGPSAVRSIEAGAPSIRIDLSGPETEPSSARHSGAAESPVSLHALLISEAGRRVFRAPFLHKPWVEDYAAYVSASTSRPWYLARSSEFTTSPRLAQEQAFEDAARQLAPLVTQRIARRQTEHAVVIGALPGGQMITGELTAALARGEFIVDRFAQQLSRPYGNVFRQTLLLEADPGRLDAVAERFIRFDRTRRATWLTSSLSLAALFAVVCFVYLFLNAATKGYYAGSLRAVLFVVTTAGAAVLLLLA